MKIENVLFHMKMVTGMKNIQMVTYSIGDKNEKVKNTQTFSDGDVFKW